MGRSALLIRLAATPLSCCTLGFGIGSLDWVSGDSVSALRGAKKESDGREWTDDPEVLTEALLLRDPMYCLLDRYFFVMHSLDLVLVLGCDGFGRARREFPWYLDGVGG